MCINSFKGVIERCTFGLNVESLPLVGHNVFAQDGVLSIVAVQNFARSPSVAWGSVIDQAVWRQT